MLPITNFVPVVAFFMAFHRILPVPLIMLHYSIVSTWIGRSGCEDTDLKGFMVYWSFMMIFAFFWGLGIHWFVRITGDFTKKILFCVWNGVLSMALFMTWSFIRAKPFKCFDSEGDIAYVFGPPLFWFIHIITAFSVGVFISRHGQRDLENFVQMKEVEEA